jgi:hypothetical protein
MLRYEAMAVVDADRHYCRVVIFSCAPATCAALGFGSRLTKLNASKAFKLR